MRARQTDCHRIIVSSLSSSLAIGLRPRFALYNGGGLGDRDWSVQALWVVWATQSLERWGGRRRLVADT